LEALLVGYSEGDVAAFSEFYQRTKPLLFKFIKGRTPITADAEEVFQETYFRVHRYITSYNKSQSAIVWLLTIARHAAIDRRKALRRQEVPREYQTDARQTPGNQNDIVEFRELLAKACLGLTQEDISLLVDRVLMEESFEDLARIYGTTAQNLRQKLSRLLRRIRSAFPPG
jgi:RNA polymerase sigma factor (sigma-70 family)